MFGDKTKQKIVDQVEGLITDYTADLDFALLKCGETLSLSINTKVKPTDDGGNDVTTTLSFTKEKVSDSQNAYVNENQEQMF